jgi:hypothetical protein
MPRDRNPAPNLGESLTTYQRRMVAEAYERNSIAGIRRGYDRDVAPATPADAFATTNDGRPITLDTDTTVDVGEMPRDSSVAAGVANTIPQAVENYIRGSATPYRSSSDILRSYTMEDSPVTRTNPDQQSNISLSSPRSVTGYEAYGNPSIGRYDAVDSAKVDETWATYQGLKPKIKTPKMDSINLRMESLRQPINAHIDLSHEEMKKMVEESLSPEYIAEAAKREIERFTNDVVNEKARQLVIKRVQEVFKMINKDIEEETMSAVDLALKSFGQKYGTPREDSELDIGSSSPQPTISF